LYGAVCETLTGSPVANLRRLSLSVSFHPDDDLTINAETKLPGATGPSETGKKSRWVSLQNAKYSGGRGETAVLPDGSGPTSCSTVPS
jgi:hypothetical protein